MNASWLSIGQKIKGVQTGNSFVVEQVCQSKAMGLVVIARRSKDGQ